MKRSNLRKQTTNGIPKTPENKQIPETDGFQTKRCNHCNAVVPNDDLFCPECGLTIGEGM